MNKKNKLLILGIAVMVLVSYQFAIKKTVATFGSYNENQKNAELIGNIPKKLALLKQKEVVLDEQLLKLKIDGGSFQSNLLKFLNHHAQLNSVKIIAFNASHLLIEENKTVETFIFDLEGNYTDILKTINVLENNGSFGTVVHLNIEKIKNYRSKKIHLQAKVFLEQIR